MTGEQIANEIKMAKTVAEQVQKLKEILTQRMRTERELCERLDSLAEWNIRKISLLKAMGPHLSSMDRNGEEPFSPIHEQGGEMERVLASVMNEISEAQHSLTQWYITTVSGQMWIHGSAEGLRNELQHMGVAGVQAHGAEDITARIMYDIEAFLEEMFSRSVAEEFRKIAGRWVTCTDDEKPELLEKFRNMVFDTLLGTWGATGGQLAKTSWYGRYRGTEYKEPLLRARFFMLGYTDESELQHSTLLDIDAVAHGLQECYRAISEHDLQKEDVPFLNGVFFAMLSQVSRMLLLRNHYHKKLP